MLPTADAHDLTMSDLEDTTCRVSDKSQSSACKTHSSHLLYRQTHRTHQATATKSQHGGALCSSTSRLPSLTITIPRPAGTTWMRYSSTGPCSPLFHRFTDHVHVGMFIILLLTISILTICVYFTVSVISHILWKSALGELIVTRIQRRSLLSVTRLG
jgi:hypothetical protein